MKPWALLPLLFLLLAANAKSAGLGSAPKPPDYKKLLGASRASVEKMMGPPESVQKLPDGRVSDFWGGGPNKMFARWGRNGKMTALSLRSAPTWRASLRRNGFSDEGVTPLKLGGDGATRTFQLAGLKGVSSKWRCVWSISGLEFDLMMVVPAKGRLSNHHLR